MEATKNSGTQIEIKIINAKHLWAFNFFQKLCVYAAVSLSSDADNNHPPLPPDLAQEQRTPTDPDGDGHPEWNHSTTFNLSLPNLPSPSDLFLRIVLRHHAGLIFPDRTIGEVRVPLLDLLESADAFRFADYQVRSPDGKPNGELWFAYKLNRHQTLADSDAPSVSISGYPQIFDHDLQPEDNSSNPYPPTNPPETPPSSALPSEESNHSTYPPPQYPHRPPPMWPPPPYWPPPGFMGYHPPPPPPPPGYGHPPWGYQYGRSESQQYNGGYEQRRG